MYEIEPTSRKLVNALNRGDAVAAAECYTEEGIVSPPGSPYFKGRDAIQKFWQNMLDAGLGDVELETTDFISFSGEGMETGRVSATLPGGGGSRTPVAGDYVVRWRNEGGDWKLHFDIFNFDE